MKYIFSFILYYPFINLVIDFSTKWSLKLYSITKLKYFLFKSIDIFKKKNKCVHYWKNLKNLTKFYCKEDNKKRLWQKNVPKISVEQTKNNGELYLYYAPWASSSKKFLEKLLHVAHVHLCALMKELIFKWEWI